MQYTTSYNDVPASVRNTMLNQVQQTYAAFMPLTDEINELGIVIKAVKSTLHR